MPFKFAPQQSRALWVNRVVSINGTRLLHSRNRTWLEDVGADAMCHKRL
jgi:hypothetical protein